jgi:type IV pilus assembly protein PilA
MRPTLHPRAEEGFTLIELITVVMIIGILAAVALPAFLGQRAKAQDGSAKSNARTMVSALEACYTEVAKYDPCPDGPSGAPEGNQPGQVEVTTSGEEYTIVSRSTNGNIFTVVKNADATITRSCDGTAEPLGGCDGGTW